MNVSSYTLPTKCALIDRVIRFFNDRYNESSINHHGRIGTTMGDKMWTAVVENTPYDDFGRIMFTLALATYVRPAGFARRSEMGVRLMEGRQTPDQLVMLISSETRIPQLMAMRDQHDAVIRHSDILADMLVMNETQWQNAVTEWDETAPANGRVRWWERWTNVMPDEPHAQVVTDNGNFVHMDVVMAQGGSRLADKLNHFYTLLEDPLEVALSLYAT